MPTALITGITGQDGSYLAELLLAKGYAVHGLVRRSSIDNGVRIAHLVAGAPPVELHTGEVTDMASLSTVLARVRPDEVYNLAAQSHVGVSFDAPLYTADTVYLGCVRMLEAIRATSRPVRFYQASSSEMFGLGQGPFSERSPFHPRSPYAVAKVAAYHQVVNHREAYGLFACNGILFNHESPRRGEAFVTRKITRGLARVVAGHQDKIRLGNLAARRDWGFAGDYVDAMWRMLQQDRSDDYVVATGESHSVREFLEVACALVGRDPDDVVALDPALIRPADVDEMSADPSKARAVLGWRPSMSFAELVRTMLAADLAAFGLSL